MQIDRDRDKPWKPKMASSDMSSESAIVTGHEVQRKNGSGTKYKIQIQKYRNIQNTNTKCKVQNTNLQIQKYKIQIHKYTHAKYNYKDTKYKIQIYRNTINQNTNIQIQKYN